MSKPKQILMVAAENRHVPRRLPKVVDERGFTVIDMVVALSLGALLLTGTAQVMTEVVPNFRARQAAFDVAAALRKARVIAVRDNVPVVVPFDETGSRYLTVDAFQGPDEYGRPLFRRHATRLPLGIRFTHPDPSSQAITLRSPELNEASAEFDARGRLKSTVNPGFVYLGDRHKGAYYRIGVDVSGVVRVHRWRKGEWT